MVNKNSRRSYRKSPSKKRKHQSIKRRSKKASPLRRKKQVRKTSKRRSSQRKSKTSRHRTLSRRDNGFDRKTLQLEGQKYYQIIEKYIKQMGEFSLENIKKIIRQIQKKEAPKR